MEMKNPSLPWKKKAAVFMISQCVTLFGSMLIQMAMIWYVTLQTSSGGWVTLLTLCSFVPQMILSFFAGVWADRYSRKGLIIAADIVISAATLALAVYMMTGNEVRAALPAILLVSVIRSLGAGVQTPAVSAMIPQLVPEDQLMRANAINGSIQSIAQFAAPAAAGAVMALGSFAQLLLIDVGTAAIGIGMLCLVSIPKHRLAKAEPAPLFTQMKEGIRFSFSTPFIRKLLLTYGAFILLSVPSGFMTALIAERTFGANYLYLSVNETVGFMGMVLGGLLLGAWGGFKNRYKTLALAMLSYGAFSILLGTVPRYWMFAAVLFFLSFAIPIVQSCVTTLLQERTAPDMQGRVFSLLGVMFSGFVPLGMAVFGPLADRVPIFWLPIATGAVLALLALAVLLPRRFDRQAQVN